jgi:hypothetical protein
MTNLTAPLEYFLEDGRSEFAPHRAVAKATRHLSVFRVDNFKLERVCSLDEFRMAVSMGGMLMLAYALDTLPTKGYAATWREEHEFKDLPTLQAMVAQGNHPMLVEGAMHLRNQWPNRFSSLSGYQGGVEGYGRLWDACWLDKRQVVDTTLHGVASFYPRVKEAIKYLKSTGLQLEHEQLINTVLGAMQKSHMLQFLDM